MMGRFRWHPPASLRHRGVKRSCSAWTRAPGAPPCPQYNSWPPGLRTRCTCRNAAPVGYRTQRERQQHGVHAPILQRDLLTGQFQPPWEWPRRLAAAALPGDACRRFQRNHLLNPLRIVQGKIDARPGAISSTVPSQPGTTCWHAASPVRSNRRDRSTRARSGSRRSPWRRSR